MSKEIKYRVIMEDDPVMYQGKMTYFWALKAYFDDKVITVQTGHAETERQALCDGYTAYNKWSEVKHETN